MNTTITDLLPVNSNIHGTPFEDLINNTIGYFLELIEEEIDHMNDGCFIDTAEGRYLDLWGKDYGISRLNYETDEDYRKRLKILPLGRFTIQTVYDIYDLQLLTKRYGQVQFDDEKLYSDNHFLSNVYFTRCSDETWDDLNKKFTNLTLTKRPDTGQYVSDPILERVRL